MQRQQSERQKRRFVTSIDLISGSGKKDDDLLKTVTGTILLSLKFLLIPQTFLLGRSTGCLSLRPLQSLRSSALYRVSQSASTSVVAQFCTVYTGCLSQLTFIHFLAWRGALETCQAHPA